MDPRVVVIVIVAASFLLLISIIADVSNNNSELQRELSNCEAEKNRLETKLNQTQYDLTTCLNDKKSIFEMLSDCQNKSTKWEDLYHKCNSSLTNCTNELASCRLQLDINIFLRSVAKGGITLLSVVLFLISLCRDLFEADKSFMTKRKARFLLICSLMILSFGVTFYGW